MKRFFLFLAFALLGVFFWLRSKAASAAEQGTSSDLGIDIGAQVGSNLTINETTGSVLAKAISDIFDSGKQGSFEYVGPDFVLRTSTLDLGGRTLLHVITSAQEFQTKAGLYQRNVGFNIILMPFNIPGSYGNFVEVVGTKQPTFDPTVPSTYIIQ